MKAEIARMKKLKSYHCSNILPKNVKMINVKFGIDYFLQDKIFILIINSLVQGPKVKKSKNSWQNPV
jgi:hypothetical protein